MPITDRTSKALLNFSGSQDGQLTPTFPSFLPLETFDNTEFDCRTPEEWMGLGECIAEHQIIEFKLINFIGKDHHVC